jgi:tRNA1Val (adenine37-N6)-methyltransferase
MSGLCSFHSNSETLDTLFEGKIQVIQKKTGYRFSMDAVLLSGFAWLRRGDKVIDLGTGGGIIPLILSKREEGAAQIIGVEIQSALLELATKNVHINGLDDLITICRGDIRDLNNIFPPSHFDVIVSNPPYYQMSSGRINPCSQKAIARHEITCTIDAVLQATRYLLKEGGRMFIIFPARRAITLLDSLRGATLEPKRLRWVHSREGEEAKFILIEAHKRGGEGVTVMSPLFIYTPHGKFTLEMESLYSFSAPAIAWKGE